MISKTAGSLNIRKGMHDLMLFNGQPRLVLFLLALICCAALLCGCSSSHQSESLAAKIETDGNAESHAIEKVGFSELYANLPDNVSLPQDENQAYPWALNAEVICPMGIDNVDEIYIKQCTNIINKDWPSVVDCLTTPAERENALKRNDADMKFYFENDAYAISLSVFEGMFKYAYAEKKIRNLNDGFSKFKYVECGDAANCKTSFVSAMQEAERILNNLSVCFSYELWRAGGRSPVDAANKEGDYVILFSQIINNIPVANPCQQGGNYGDLYVPDVIGARLIIDSRGIREMRLQGYEIAGTVKHFKKLISLNSAIELFKSFTEENVAAVDPYHTIIVNPHNSKVTYAEQAVIDQIRLCYVATVSNDNNALMLVPCWLFSCGSSNNGTFGVGFHAVTGEVVWLNYNNI